MRSRSHATVSRQAHNNLLRFNDYSFAKPKNPKDKSYFALFRDGTVRKVATNGIIWGWFFRDKSSSPTAAPHGSGGSAFFPLKAGGMPLEPGEGP